MAMIANGNDKLVVTLLRKRVARQIINHSMSFQYFLIKNKNFLIQALLSLPFYKSTIPKFYFKTYVTV